MNREEAILTSEISDCRIEFRRNQSINRVYYEMVMIEPLNERESKETPTRFRKHNAFYPCGQLRRAFVNVVPLKEEVAPIALPQPPQLSETVRGLSLVSPDQSRCNHLK
jgi:hypothetical protein